MTRKAMFSYRDSLVVLLQKFRTEERKREAGVVELVIDMLDDVLHDEPPDAILNLDRNQLERLACPRDGR
jgi:hypothetical protein